MFLFAGMRLVLCLMISAIRPIMVVTVLTLMRVGVMVMARVAMARFVARGSLRSMSLLLCPRTICCMPFLRTNLCIPASRPLLVMLTLLHAALALPTASLFLRVRCVCCPDLDGPLAFLVRVGLVLA